MNVSILVYIIYETLVDDLPVGRPHAVRGALPRGPPNPLAAAGRDLTQKSETRGLLLQRHHLQ